MINAAGHPLVNAQAERFIIVPCSQAAYDILEKGLECRSVVLVPNSDGTHKLIVDTRLADPRQSQTLADDAQNVADDAQQIADELVADDAGARQDINVLGNPRLDPHDQPEADGPAIGGQ